MSMKDQSDQYANISLSTNYLSKELNLVLPVDSYQEEILQKIRESAIVFIQGGTGCGKSTRVPVILLHDAEERNKACKIIITQPRRIAVQTLAKRLRMIAGSQMVGIKMKGVRDVAASNRITLVTAGYMLRLLGSNISSMSSTTHFIIDEVHERSVDGDLLCYYAKTLLTEYPTLKIILMSATLHNNLYYDYFSELFPSNPDKIQNVSIEGKKFTNNIFYIEDLMTSELIKKANLESCKTIMTLCSQIQIKTENKVPIKILTHQLKMAEFIIRNYASLGSGVLVFCSGLANIMELSSKFENDTDRFVVFAIHSDVPLDEQQGAFEPVPDKIKVVLATNAAESSITLPDVDIVICLGTHKAIRLNLNTQSRNSVVLAESWISKSSATQRAGRTGRVRPGNVFRLYSQDFFESMDEFADAEINRSPLHEVILNLKANYELDKRYEGVKAVLGSLIEPPNMLNVDQGYDYLHELGMVSEPNDNGQLTHVGNFSGKLMIGAELCRMIYIGLAMDLGYYAIVLASAMSQPKTVFRMISPFIQRKPEDMTESVQSVFYGMHELDSGCYSEPIMMLRLFLMFSDDDTQSTSMAKKSLNRKSQSDFNKLSKLGIAHVRFNYFMSYTKRLMTQIQSIFDSSSSRFKLKAMVQDFHKNPVILNRLRLLICWTSSANLIASEPKSLYKAFQVSVADYKLSELDMNQLVPKSVPDKDYEMHTIGRIQYEFVLKDEDSFHYKQLKDFLVRSLSTILSQNGWVVWSIIENDVLFGCLSTKSNHLSEYFEEDSLKIVESIDFKSNQMNYSMKLFHLEPSPKIVKKLNSLLKKLDVWVTLKVQSDGKFQLATNTDSIALSFVKQCFFPGDMKASASYRFEEPVVDNQNEFIIDQLSSNTDGKLPLYRGTLNHSLSNKDEFFYRLTYLFRACKDDMKFVYIHYIPVSSGTSSSSSQSQKDSTSFQLNTEHLILGVMKHSEKNHRKDSSSHHATNKNNAPNGSKVADSTEPCELEMDGIETDYVMESANYKETPNKMNKLFPIQRQSLSKFIAFSMNGHRYVYRIILIADPQEKELVVTRKLQISLQTSVSYLRFDEASRQCDFYLHNSSEINLLELLRNIYHGRYDAKVTIKTNILVKNSKNGLPLNTSDEDDQIKVKKDPLQGQIIVFRQDVESSNSFISDLPTGLRLLYAQGLPYPKKNGFMFIRLPNYHNEKPGTKEWQDLKSRKANKLMEEDPDVVIARISSGIPRWGIVDQSRVTESYFQIEEEDDHDEYEWEDFADEIKNHNVKAPLLTDSAVIVSSSYYGVSMHLGPELLYAVCNHKLLTLHKGRYITIFSGVTFLPVGNRWVSLALKCVGKELNLKDYSKDEENGCSVIEKILKEINDKPFGINPMLIKWIDSIFK